MKQAGMLVLVNLGLIVMPSPVLHAQITTGDGYNPVQTAAQAWWELTTSFPNVFEDPSLAGRPRYHMLFDGHGTLPGRHAKGYAYSPDLKHWTQYDAGLPHPPMPNPIVGPVVDSMTYVGSDNFSWGDAIKVGGVYYIFPYKFGLGRAVRIESTDLETWSNIQPLVNIQPAGIPGDVTIGTGVAILKQGDGITPVSVDGKYWMVYFHGDKPGKMWLAYSDTSGNLLNWTLTNVLLSPTPGRWDAAGLWTPSFVRLNSKYYIYTQGDSGGGFWETGYASAVAYDSGGNPVRPDATTWTKSAESAIKHGAAGSWDSNFCTDPMIRQFSDGVFYLFYTGNSGNGYATASSPEGPWVKMDKPVEPVTGDLPQEVLLEQNYPNPFNPSTTIRFGLPQRSYVTLTVFNSLGQRVALLVNWVAEAGYHEVEFDGSGLASGVYFYRLKAGDFVVTKKLLLVK